MSRRLRVLLLADTHLGFDLPLRPRSARLRRGPDFFANTERALAPALRGEVDLVVHGGDLLFRSRVEAGLVDAALAPLRRVADAGVPVYLVPGNHERSTIPCGLLARHPRLHVFDRPRSFLEEELGVALAGFPFHPRASRLAPLLEATGWRQAAQPIRLLCLHQAMEGGRAGYQDHVFRRGEEVVPARELPRGLAAVLSGHLHRAQTLVQDLEGRLLPAPVLYPGAIERTSFSEREERKGYLLLEFAEGPPGGRLADCRFVPLPTRPMKVLELEERSGLGWLREELTRLAPGTVVQLRTELATPPIAIAELRRIAPELLIQISCRPPLAGRPRSRSPRGDRRAASSSRAGSRSR